MIKYGAVPELTEDQRDDILLRISRIRYAFENHEGETFNEFISGEKFQAFDDADVLATFLAFMMYGAIRQTGHIEPLHFSVQVAQMLTGYGQFKREQ